jgi:hypothetical protein
MSYRDYVLAELRCAHIRAQLLVNEIDTVGWALKHGFIDEDKAVEWAWAIGAMEYLQHG